MSALKRALVSAAVAVAASVLSITGATYASPITPGNLVIFRAGDGAAPLGTAATAAFLDEYTTAGALVQSIAIPSTGSSALTVAGNSTTEGVLGRSQDGTKLVFIGYRKDAGGTAPNSDAASVTNRVFGLVGLNGVVDTSNGFNDAGVTGNARSATTVDGTFFYAGTSTGVRYVAAPGIQPSTLLDNRNSRQVQLTGNTLFASNGSTSTTNKVQNYGTLPTGATTPTPVVVLATADAVNGIFFADLNAAVPGDDTLYALSTVENLLRKYTFDGTNWNANGSVPASTAANLTGIVSGGNVNLFLTSSSSLFSFTDTSGINGPLSGTLSAPLATAATNTGFRGISTLALIPEPGTMLLLGLCAGGMMLRRRSV